MIGLGLGLFVGDRGVRPSFPAYVSASGSSLLTSGGLYLMARTP